jgi:hypothetical protein
MARRVKDIQEREVKMVGPCKGLWGCGRCITGHTELWVDMIRRTQKVIKCTERK